MKRRAAGQDGPPAGDKATKGKAPLPAPPTPKRPAPPAADIASLQAEHNGMKLHLAPGSHTGYRCVTRSSTSVSRPFEVRISKDGKKESI